MATARFEVEATSTSRTQLEVRARDFTFTIDEPESLGGGDRGPNPVEYTLAALLGCLNVLIHFVARERGISINSLTARAYGKLDFATFMGTSDRARAGLADIVVDLVIDADASEEQIADIVRAAEKRCPVFDNLAHPTPISIRPHVADARSAEA